MNQLKKYKLILLCLVLINIPSTNAKNFDNYNKQIDSLLNDYQNRVFEKPNESIELGISVFENTSNSPTIRTRGLMLLALAYSSKRNYEKALEYIIKAKEFSNELDNPQLQLEILFRTGIIYQQLKMYDKAIEYMDDIERIVLTTPNQYINSGSLANSYVVKGFIYKDNLNCDIALDFFDKGLNEYYKLEIENNANKSITYYNKGNCYILLSEYDNAKKSFYEAIKFANLEKANSLISFAKKGLAEVLSLEGKHEKAVILLHEALNQSKDVGDLVLNSTIYTELFENYLVINKLDEYKRYYNLYLNTQMELKISERNSISNSIDKETKSHLNRLNDLQNSYTIYIRWLIISLIVVLVPIIIFYRQSLKSIKKHQRIIDSLQSTKTNS